MKTKLSETASKFLNLFESTKHKVGDKVIITRRLNSEGLPKGSEGVITKVDYDGSASGEPSEYTAKCGSVSYHFDESNRWVTSAS